MNSGLGSDQRIAGWTLLVNGLVGFSLLALAMAFLFPDVPPAFAVFVGAATGVLVGVGMALVILADALGGRR